MKRSTAVPAVLLSSFADADSPTCLLAAYPFPLDTRLISTCFVRLKRIRDSAQFLAHARQKRAHVRFKGVK